MEKSTALLSHQLAFQVQVHVKGKSIHHTIINIGASTCVMATSCWFTLGYPTLSPPLNYLKDFDCYTFTPKEYLSRFPITLCGKTISIDIKVVDSSLDYNLLLGRSRTYKM